MADTIATLRAAVARAAESEPWPFAQLAGPAAGEPARRHRPGWTVADVEAAIIDVCDDHSEDRELAGRGGYTVHPGITGRAAHAVAAGLAGTRWEVAP